MQTTIRQWMGAMLMLVVVVCLGGCATDSKNVDPWESTNRFFYKFNDGLDRYALKPMADAYVKVVPKPVRTGISNGFDNLEYGNVILNDFLQGKGDQGMNDVGRMVVNSLIGVAGIFDVATQWDMPAHENDFGITLGVWGAKPGPYLVLPLFGPSTVRDAPAIPVGMATNPVTWLDLYWYETVPLYTLEAVDGRSRMEREWKFRNAAAIDEYVFTRDAYLQYREGQISSGKAATTGNIYDEDAEPTTGPTIGPATGPTTEPATRPAVGVMGKAGEAMGKEAAPATQPAGK